MELLAQIVEVVSVGAANMRLKKPVKIPRPNRDEPRITSSSSRSTGPAEDENPYASAINRLASVQPERHLHVVADDDEGQDPA
jgi:hypothetical protein